MIRRRQKANKDNYVGLCVEGDINSWIFVILASLCVTEIQWSLWQARNTN